MPTLPQPSIGSRWQPLIEPSDGAQGFFGVSGQRESHCMVCSGLDVAKPREGSSQELLGLHSPFNLFVVLPEPATAQCRVGSRHCSSPIVTEPGTHPVGPREMLKRVSIRARGAAACAKRIDNRVRRRTLDLPGFD